MQSRSNGFTLIETIIATGILAFAAAAIASLFVSSLRTHMINRQRSTAAILLCDKIEQLKTARLAPDGSDEVADYRRVWRIEGVDSKTITVVIYDRANLELMRASTVASPTW